MSRFGLALFALLSLAVFSGGVWGGLYFHKQNAVTKTLQGNGWCCIPKNLRCEISAGATACEEGGGATFNWGRTACEESCLSITKRLNP